MADAAARSSRACAARSSPTSASPTRSSSTSRCSPQFDTRDTERALRGHGHRGARRWTPTPRSSGTTGSASSTPTSTRTARSRAPSTAARSSSPARRAGIGQAAAMKIATAGGIPLLVARSDGEARGGQGGDRGRRRHRVRLLGRPLRPGRDRRASSRRCSTTTRRSTCSSTTPGRSIRRSMRAQLRPLPRLRAHDAAQLLRHDPLIMALLPHMKERGFGHIVNVSLDRRADQPAALQRLRRVEGRARRVDARASARRSSATASRSRRSTCRSCGRR